MFFGDAFFGVAGVGDGAEGDFPGAHESIVAQEFCTFEEAADGIDRAFFEVDGDRGMEGVDQGGEGEVVGVSGEGAFFEALVGGEEFAVAAFDFGKFVDFVQVHEVESSHGKGELAGFVEGEFAGAEGVPGEDVPGGDGVESGGVGLGEFVEAVVGDRFAGFGEGLFGADFVAGGVEDGVVAAEDVEGGTEGAEVEVDAVDVVGFKFGRALFDKVGDFGAEVIPPCLSCVGVAFAANEQDGTRDAVFLGLVQVLRVFGADCPACGDFKSCDD